MKIPLVDLTAQYESIKTEVDLAIASVIRDTAYIGFSTNPHLVKFEEEFAKWNEASFAVGCANGTDTLELLLRAWNIGPGDEVIVPAHTWISTSEAVTWTGAKPVFVDTDANYLIDIKKISTKINSRTKAIIPVHLYGCPVDMPALLEISQKKGLKVLEDCAQAHGAQIGSKKVGTFGDGASFSFYPGKNLGAYGDAGAIITNDLKTAEKVRILRNHGRTSKSDHEVEGRNSRMDGIQAAVLSAKLKYLDRWTELRIQNAAYYSQNIKKHITPITPRGIKHVFHLYAVRVQNREAVESRMHENKIEIGVHYPQALVQLQAYKSHQLNLADYANSIAACREVVSLPLYPEITKVQMDRVIKVLEES